MKKLKNLIACIIIGLATSVFIGCTAGYQENSSTAESAELIFAAEHARQFPTWFYEEATWRSIEAFNPLTNQASGFISDASGRPSMDDIELILNTASLAATAGDRADWYMVLVTDTATQTEIIGSIYNTPIITSDGTVTILIFSERLIRQQYRTDNIVSFSPDVGYYNVGILTGFLNMASAALGYGSRVFTSLAIPGGGFNEGTRWLETEHFLQEKEYILSPTKTAFSTENMKLVSAIVIGTPDRSLETFSTQSIFPTNWSLWEPDVSEVMQISEQEHPPIQGTAIDEEIEHEPTNEHIQYDYPIEELAEPEPIMSPMPAIPTPRDGTFRGTASGYDAAPLIVDVTIQNGVIQSIDVVSHGETEVYFVMASRGFGGSPGVIPSILQNNSTQYVDVVSGATGSSIAIINAIEHALYRSMQLEYN